MNKYLSKSIYIKIFDRYHCLTVNPLLHRPGNTRRGVIVCFHFQHLGWYTSTSRQSPQIERESDQSTVKGFNQ